MLQFAEEDGEPVTAAAPKKDEPPSDQTIVNVDNEHSLLVMRASGGSTTVAMGRNRLSASVAIGAFEIQDLLVGAVCKENSYLARSSLQDGATLHLSSMQRAQSHGSTASSKDEFQDAAAELPATGQQQQDLSQQALLMEYTKRTPQSADYRDVDAQVHLKLKALSFCCNRPTLGALMAIGDDVSATLAAQPPDAPAAAAAVQNVGPAEDQGPDLDAAAQSDVETGESLHLSGLLSR